ncbi:mitochondrial carrier [Hysterangium stoloniferum]|nr:mitochondrial carrier [Hysterangium stoloniferum]
MSRHLSASTNRPSTHRREIFEGSYSGAQERPYIPRLRSDPPAWHWLPRTLSEYREREGKENREARLRALWERLPKGRRASERDNCQLWTSETDMDSAHATHLWYMYEDELMRRCSSTGTSTITWPDFLDYADKKEAELWTIFHDELDLDNNGHLDADELFQALGKAGIRMSPATLSEFMTSLASSSHSHAISFPEFRDFLLLLPRPASTTEIYRYYKVRKFLGDDGRGAARVNMEGDVSLSAEDRPQAKKINIITVHGKDLEAKLALDDEPVVTEDIVSDEHLETEEDDQNWVFGHTARYLFAGGIAGAVSRTATAPFDRLKIFLITRPPDLGGLAGTPAIAPTQGIRALGAAVVQLYTEGGIRAFWVGNGLNLVKIFPESAVKFMTYEQTKMLFAKHWDHVEDPRNISGGSRFMSGGMGGIVSQLFIYPIETLKTQMMSSTGDQRRTVASSMRRLWSMGGFPAYYRGLTVRIIGVFPYSAIDMSTFEALKLAYLRSTGKAEPGVLAILAFGSISGSIGATSVYPLNLVRTRLQASGSSGHPQKYTGVWDVASKTLAADGWRGFYRGLFPTLAKVVPSVSISYVVYEYTKRRLGV